MLLRAFDLIAGTQLRVWISTGFDKGGPPLRVLEKAEVVARLVEEVLLVVIHERPVPSEWLASHLTGS